ncbi:MAG: TadE family protein [Pseudomonadota bacterium]
MKLQSVGRIVKVWLKNEEAATAVEFSLIAFPFTYLLMGIIELSLMFAAMSTLDYATNSAARLIRTGQVQQSTGDPEQVFKDALCAYSSAMLDCTRFQYEVIKLDSFSDFSSYPPSFDDEGNLMSSGFDPGQVDDVVLIRTAYKYPLLTPLLASAFSDTSNNNKLMMSTTVLETEPYDVNQVVDEL